MIIRERLVHGRWLITINVSSSNATDCTSNRSGRLLKVAVKVVNTRWIFECIIAVVLAGSDCVHRNHVSFCKFLSSMFANMQDNDDDTDNDDTDDQQKSTDDDCCNDYLSHVTRQVSSALVASAFK